MQMSEFWRRQIGVLIKLSLMENYAKIFYIV